MNVFRYLVVKYKPQEIEKPTINIGVIIQSDDSIDCKFSQNIEKVKGVVGSEKIDEMIFKNLENTFKSRFQEKFFTITDKQTGLKKQIAYTSPEYLDYLTTNFLNNYYFNNRGQIEEEDIHKGLVRLYKDFVDPTYSE